MITLDLADGLVSASSIESAFGPLLVVVMGYTTDLQHVALVDVEAVETGTAQITMRVVSFIGSGYERDSPPSTTYAANDWRSHAFGSTTPSASCVCGAQPSSTTRCMNGEIEYRINVANPPVSGFVYTNVETWTVTRNPTNTSLRNYYFNDAFLQNPNDPDFDWCYESMTYSWWQWCGLQSPCVSPALQTYWTSGTWSAVAKIRQTYCPSKHFKVCTIGTDWWVPSGQLEAWFIHQCAFTYGIRIAK